MEKKNDSSLQMTDIFVCDAFAGLDDIIIDWHMHDSYPIATNAQIKKLLK